jgi:hypothetical protein
MICKSSLVTIPEIVGIDSEFDGIASNAIAEQSINRVLYGFDCNAYPARIIKLDTLRNGPIHAELARSYRIESFDIVHADGCHSPEGIKSELEIADTWVAPDGLILVDDIDVPHVRAAADKYCVDRGIYPVELPTLHGLYVIDMALAG